MDVTARNDPQFPLARISNLALLATIVTSTLALLRFRTFHNETFDLAFYARLVWGLGHGDRYQPFTHSYFWGLHASPILFLIAQVGRIVPIVPLLLVLQAAAVCAAAIPLARIAARRIGHVLAADVTLVVYLLYPTVFSVVTYEFHPSTLAVFPLAQALEYFDRRVPQRALAALLVAATCREDAALVAAFIGLAAAFRSDDRRVGSSVFAIGSVWFCIYMFVIAPRFLPRHGSLDLHFGHLGSQPSAVVHTLLRHPIATFALLGTRARLSYVPRLLAPVAFLSLLAPRWLLPAIVPVAINLLSQFPTAVQVQSHYSILAVPFVIASAAHAAGRIAAQAPGAINRYVLLVAAAVGLGTLWMQHRAGATPLSRRWDVRAFSRDVRTRELPPLLDLIPRDASVVAPDFVVAHLAERPTLQRLADWTQSLDDVVLPTEYRARFGTTQELWRSSEERVVRNTLAGDAYGLFATQGRELLMRHGWAPRAYARGRYVEFAPEPGLHDRHIDIGPSIALAGWGIRGDGLGTLVTLLLVARAAWPPDVGFEIGWGPMHSNRDRQDPAHIVAVLPFDGLFSPAHVRIGEVVRERIVIDENTGALLTQNLYFGARRVDGSRLDPTSEHWTLLSDGASPE